MSLSYLQGNFQVNGRPQNGATINLYDANSFSAPPTGGSALLGATATPTTGILATTVTGPANGCDGGWRFAVASSGQWWIGVAWNGYYEWDYRQLSGNPIPTIKDYGAVGNGVADDTAAIQSAVNSLQSDTIPGQVIIPPGTYRLTSAIALAHGVRLIGQGGVLKFQDNPTAGSMLDVTGSNVQALGVIFDGNISGQSVYNEQHHAIKLEDATDVVVRGCRFQNLIGDGVYVSRGASASAPYIGSQRVQIHGNEFIGANTNRNGISLVCCQGVTVHGNTFVAMSRADEPGAVDLESNNSNEFIKDVSVVGNTFIGGTAAIAQTSIQFGGPGMTKRVAVHGNTFQATNVSTPIKIAGSYVLDFSVVGNTISGSGMTQGIQVGAGAFRGVIDGNTIFGPNTTAGIRAVGTSVTQLSGIVITNNVIDMTGTSGAATACIDAEHITYSNIRGNQCFHGVYGILLDRTDSTDVSISGNTLKNQTTAGIYQVAAPIFDVRISENTISCDSTAISSYDGIRCQRGSHVFGNSINITTGHAGIYCLGSSGIVDCNIVRSIGATNSIVTAGGTNGQIVQNNRVTGSITDGGGASSSTIGNNITIP